VLTAVLCVSFADEQDDTKKPPPKTPATAARPTTPNKVKTPPPSSAKQSPLAAAAAAAAERRKRSKGRTFSNEDLRDMYGGSEFPPAPAGEASERAETPSGEGATAAAPTPVDPKAWLAQRKLDEQEKQKAIAAAEAEVKSLEERLQVLERRALTAANPFLERPKVDPDKEPDNKDWDKLDSKQRVERTRQELESVRKQLDDARKRLTDARRRN
jgi:hypothetical protein